MPSPIARALFQPLPPHISALASLLGAALVAPFPIAAIAHAVAGVPSVAVTYVVCLSAGVPATFVLLWRGWHRWWQYLAAGLVSAVGVGLAYAGYVFATSTWAAGNTLGTALTLAALSISLAAFPAVPTALLAWLFLRKASRVLSERLRAPRAA